MRLTRCKNCNALLVEDATFCGQCGSVLGATSQATIQTSKPSYPNIQNTPTINTSASTIPMRRDVTPPSFPPVPGNVIPTPFPLSEQDLTLIKRDDEHTYDVSTSYYNETKERLSQQPTGPLTTQRKDEDEDDFLPLVGVAGAVSAPCGQAPTPAASGTPLVGQAPLAQGTPHLYHNMQNRPVQALPGHRANRPGATAQPKKRNKATSTLRHTMRVKPLLVATAAVVAVAVITTTLFITHAIGPSSSNTANHVTPTPPAQVQVFNPKMSTSGDMVPGGTIKLHGTGFPPGGQVVMKLDGKALTGDTAGPTALTSTTHTAPVFGPVPLAGTPAYIAAAQDVIVKTDGSFDTQITLPKDWQPGTQHHIQASVQGTQGSADFDLAVTIIKPGGTPTQTTCIAVSSNQLSFTGTGGKNDPATQTISISNCGDTGVWTGKASPDSGGDWLSIDKTSGTLAGGKKQTITVTASNLHASLASGSYTGHITFTLGASAETVDVTLSVSSNPCIKVDQSSLAFSGVAGTSDPAAQTVNISDCGDDEGWTTKITTDDGAAWLGVNPASGTLKAGESKASAVTTSNQNTSLSAGTYHGTIIFTAGEKSASVSVTFTVSLAPCITSNPTSLSFTGIANKQDPASQQLTLTNCGLDGSWSAAVNYDDGSTGWLGSDTSGTLSANANQKVTVSSSNKSASLSAGTYQGHIIYTITTNIGTKSTTVGVTLTVTKGACISPGSSSFTFSGIANASDPSPSSQKETLTNCGDDGNWSASISSSATSWLKLDASSGSLTSASTQDVNISAFNKAAGLSAGTYTGSIDFTITSASGDTNKQSVTVTLTVYAPTCFQFSQINGQTASDPQTDALTFNAVAAESNPKDQAATIANCGSDSGDWSASVTSGGSWLSANPSSNTLAAGASSDVTISAINQSAGNYTGQIVFTLKGPGGSASITLNVTLTVQAGSCISIVSVDGNTPSDPSNVSLSFRGTAGATSATPASHSVTIKNCGGDGTWSVSTNSTSWLSAGDNCDCNNSMSDSIKAGDTVVIYVYADPYNLSAGSYSGSVTFSIHATAASSGQSTDANVSFTVQQPVTSCLSIYAVNGSTPPSSGAIDFYGTAGSSSPGPQTVTLANCGSDGTVTTSISYDSNGSGWLSTNPDISGGTSLTAGNQLSLDLYANPASLSGGDYSASIKFTITNSAGSYTQTLTVNFHVKYYIG